MKYKTSLKSNFYRDTPHLPEGEPYMWYFSRIEARPEDNNLFVTSKRNKQVNYGTELDSSDFSINVVFDDWEGGVDSVYEFLLSVSNSEGVSDIETSVPIQHGEANDSLNDEQITSSEAFRLTYSSERGLITFYLEPHVEVPIFTFEEERNNEICDHENLHNLLDFFSGLVGAIYPEQILSNSLEERLMETTYGHNIINHIEDGDFCLSNEKYHPALSCYIHAFEWTFITYLEDERDKDIIEEEKDGDFYYFAGGSPNLLNEVQKHTTISQTTVSKIKSLNRAERRWIAHHKTGEANVEDIEALRRRLNQIIHTMYE